MVKSCRLFRQRRHEDGGSISPGQQDVHKAVDLAIEDFIGALRARGGGLNRGLRGGGPLARHPFQKIELLAVEFEGFFRLRSRGSRDDGRGSGRALNERVEQVKIRGFCLRG